MSKSLTIAALLASLTLGGCLGETGGEELFDQTAYQRGKHHFNAGMIGINVGVPAPMAWFPFTGWNRSFFGDLHIQGTESIQFYTRQKMTLTRWFEPAGDTHEDPVWKTTRND